MPNPSHPPHRQPILDAPVFRCTADASGLSVLRSLNHWPWQRLLIVGLGELGLVALLTGMFWYQDWRYSLPTPRPPHLRETPLGTFIDIPMVTGIDLIHRSKRPVLLHFFNPDCPCSRFNIDHVRALHQQFADRVDFVAVLEGVHADQLRQQFARLDFPLSVIVDTDRSLADSTGVYATPQAVILDRERRLHYCGNYNASRYCIAPQTEYARLALEDLLQETTTLAPRSAAASRPYGCPLPAFCEKGAGS